MLEECPALCDLVNLHDNSIAASGSGDTYGRIDACGDCDVTRLNDYENTVQKTACPRRHCGGDN